MLPAPCTWTYSCLPLSCWHPTSLHHTSTTMPNGTCTALELNRRLACLPDTCCHPTRLSFLGMCLRSSAQGWPERFGSVRGDDGGSNVERACQLEAQQVYTHKRCARVGWLAFDCDSRWWWGGTSHTAAVFDSSYTTTAIEQRLYNSSSYATAAMQQRLYTLYAGALLRIMSPLTS